MTDSSVAGDPPASGRLAHAAAAMRLLRTGLPPGRRLELPGRGTTFIRELEGPPGAPVLMLLHGWTATGGLNWATSMHELAREFRVIAIDHRGHGRGLRAREPFTLENCADDVSAALAALGIPRATLVGYSMGGPIAQLCWRRHPEQVEGLVLAATAGRFDGSRPIATPMQLIQGGMGIVPSPLRRSTMPLANLGLWRALPVMEEMGRNDPRSIVQAGHCLSRYNALPWLPQVSVPTAVVVTTRDLLVPPALQYRMARLIRGARSFTLDAGHLAAGSEPRFAGVLRAACHDVVQRALAARESDGPGVS
jgi:3-oxoadipate enol-lactonase